MSSSHGKLVGVSLGPGDPGLITRRAWDALRSGARWLYPVRHAGEKSYALSIAERAGLPIPSDAVELVFPMTRDARALDAAWIRAAGQTIDFLAENRDAAFLVEGDASTFATFGHLARTVRERLPDAQIETIAGVSSFAAAAAIAGVPLGEEGEKFAILPAICGIEAMDCLLDEFDTLVLLKVKPILGEIIDWLERRGLADDCCFIEKVGASDERVVRGVAALRDEEINYLSLMLVRKPKGKR
ncbi:MAG: precorrin-2 C(20)-methyltransferase [Candidatus Accumulibacter sp.]|nr:precorrin-2 C(20)-methyltransferase [Accumulibacter sp.]